MAVKTKAEFHQFVLANSLRWLNKEEIADLCLALFVRCDRQIIDNLIKKYDEENTNFTNFSISE